MVPLGNPQNLSEQLLLLASQAAWVSGEPFTEVATGRSEPLRHPLAHQRSFVIEQADQGIDLR